MNQATLRHWGDSGKVRIYTTPGGHRRFLETELVSLVDQKPAAASPALAQALVSCRERYEALARRCLAEAVWFRSFDDIARRRFRILGSSMLSLISAFLSGGRRERERVVAEGRDIALEYGAEAARLGLSLPQATEAFLLFRTPVLEGISHWIHENRPPQREADELLRRANFFMDQVLLAMAAAHEQARAGGGRS